MNKTGRIQLRVPDELINRLEKEAGLMQISVSQYIRFILERRPTTVSFNLKKQYSQIVVRRRKPFTPKPVTNLKENRKK